MRKNWFLPVIIITIAFFSNTCTKVTPITPDTLNGIIDADHAKIHYVGRFDRSNPKSVQFDWPGVYIRAAFQGTSCSVRLIDGKNLYNVTIDDKTPQVLATDTATVYPVATGLADTVHTIQIEKRTEAFVGVGTFLGFILDEGSTLAPLEQIPQRRMEFIGNSITCGYGVEGASANEPFKPETENASLSYAGIVGRSLQADYALVAYSGKGVVRNYGDANKTSTEPLPFVYERTCYNNATLIWDYSYWVPHVVVINLGTNDFSTEPHPDKSVFQEAYTDLINRVQSQYPDVSVFCVCGPMIGEPCCAYIKEAVEQCQQNNENNQVYFINVGSNLLTMNDRGSDWHPNISGQQKTADKVIPLIKETMNW